VGGASGRAVAGDFSVGQEGEGHAGEEGGAVAAAADDLSAPDFVARDEGQDGFLEMADPFGRVEEAPAASEQFLRAVVAIHAEVGGVDVNVIAVRIGEGEAFVGVIEGLGEVAEADGKVGPLGGASPRGRG